jgi:hypothetical protein
MAGVHKDDSKNAGANISAKERFYASKELQNRPPSAFFTEGNQRLYLPGNLAPGLPLPKATKVADESDAQSHSNNTILLEKTGGCV